MSGSLRCYSFHSVKGGVGKSTLSVLAALGLAQHGSHSRVTLVDMDLTGTSLADVLPLESPAWPEVAPDGELPLLRRPSGFLSVKETRYRMERRDELARQAPIHESEPTEPPALHGVPFLNDFLLFATPDWDEQRDVPVESILWRMEGMPFERLRVIPSSALPVDLERTIPVVFDENHSGFLEGRLEYLLDGLVPAEGEAVVVMDTPPTIPGLSRSVLSLALRLSDEGDRKKKPLAEDGFMPPRLRDARVTWTAFVVGTMDHQDVRAANRWLSLVQKDEEHQVRFLFNRVPPGDEQQVQGMIEALVEGERSRILDSAAYIRENRALSFFRASEVPTIHESELAFLQEKKSDAP